jgi:hypothetical protein
MSENKSENAIINSMEFKDISVSTINNWDSVNDETLHLWIQDCDKKRFTYDYSLDKLIEKSKCMKITLLIFSAIQTLLTVSILGLTGLSETTTLCINVINSILAAIIYSLNQYSGIAKFDDTIKIYTIYIENVSDFLSNIVSVADMKSELRPNGNTYILEKSNVYSTLYKNAPNLDHKQMLEAIKEYEKYSKNNDLEKGNYLLQKSFNFKKYIIKN